ncbi:pyridoxal phosphate biosynthetic protein [Qipengyuania vesicularis]|uniref:pyridoxal phosphate biosynthetic protein n=1 Tax=Qipengyuania vesicularis TaxID=2867232 RepID=UPI001C86B737|nr:pyridoxal phosphate biosynthetic protein [Qipengyuania vesicularis]MBX7526298.1 pyridoxal phosphate biosynthetic protein [Qipengyuania vesicularis]
MSAQSPSRADTLWALAAAIPFLLSIALLAYAVAQQAALAFAIGWPILQVIGYAGSLKRSGGTVDHPLVKSQVFIHWIMLVILIVMIGRTA